MATPHVAGAVALLLQKNPDWTPKEVKIALKNTALDVGENLNSQGAGQINISAAIRFSHEPLIANFEDLDFGRFGKVDIVGSAGGVGFEKYEVFYLEKSSGNWKLICSENDPVEEGILCRNFNGDNLVDANPYAKLVVSGTGKLSEDHAYFNDFKERIESKITNGEKNVLRGTLELILQKNIDGNWIDEEIVISQRITIPGNRVAKLDLGSNYGWNLKDISVDEPGVYRVYASFESGGAKKEATWNFEVIGVNA